MYYNKGISFNVLKYIFLIISAGAWLVGVAWGVVRFLFLSLASSHD